MVARGFRLVRAGWMRGGAQRWSGFTWPDRLWFIGPLPWSRPYTPTLVGPLKGNWGACFGPGSTADADGLRWGLQVPQLRGAPAGAVDRRDVGDAVGGQGRQAS